MKLLHTINQLGPKNHFPSPLSTIRAKNAFQGVFLRLLLVSPIRQEEVKAYIVLKPPATAQSLPPEEIWSFCQKHLAPFKIPRYLEYRESLPKTLSSKIQKSILRAETKSPTPVVFDRAAMEKK